MSKVYTAQEMREVAENEVCIIDAATFKDCHLADTRVRQMLRQAAEVLEENAQLKARLEAVVKECEDMRKYSAFALVDPEDFDAILRLARGEGGAK